VFFLHCDHCHSTFRAGSLDANDLDREASADLEAFHAAHAACTLRLFEPTGRATASGPWHEPLTERWLEVRDPAGLGVAIGSRASIDDPLTWRIERMGFEEEVEVALDRELFWNSVERALRPLPVPQRQVGAWANWVDNHLRTVGPADWVVLYDDTRCPDQSAGCLTLTARSHLESSLRGFGFADEVVQRLETLFNDIEFPAVRITRKISMRPTRRARAFPEDARLDSPDPLV
jgi:hypothetical protein